MNPVRLLSSPPTDASSVVILPCSTVKSLSVASTLLNRSSVTVVSAMNPVRLLSSAETSAESVVILPCSTPIALSFAVI